MVDYLNSTNRPYSTINVYDNLHGAVAKTALQRVLDKCAAEGKINMKVCGKSKVYWALQDQYGEVTPEDLKTLQAEVADLTARGKAAAAERGGLSAERDALAAQPSDAGLEEALATTKAEVEALQASFDAAVAAADGVVVSAADREALLAKGRAYRKQWSKLRGAVLEVVGRMGEGMNKSNKQLFDTIGLETDEEYGVDIKTLKF